MWFDNSREGAQCFVTNPKNRGERKVGRRLAKPARHIILQSRLYKEHPVFRMEQFGLIDFGGCYLRQRTMDYATGV